MIFGKSKLELKVGIFVFIGLAIMVTFVLLIADIKMWTGGYNVRFKFNFVNGVKVGAPVRFAGVDVGEVKEVDIVLKPKEQTMNVEISGWVKKNVKIPVDSTVWVNTLGLLGEKYIEIIPGKDYSAFLKPNGMIVGNDPLAVQEVTEITKRIAGGIEEILTKINAKEGTIGRLLYEDTIYREIETAIKNREGTIGRFFYDDTIYRELDALIKDIRSHPWKLFWKTKEKPKKQ